MKLIHNTGHNVNSPGSNAYAQLFVDHREQLRAQRIDVWSTEIESDGLASKVHEAMGGEIIYRGVDQTTSGFHEVVCHDEDKIVRVTLSSGSCFASVAAATDPEVLTIMEAIRGVVPKAIAQDHTVPVRFWAMGEHGPSQFFRSIHVPEWDEIKDNYHSDTCDQLVNLMADFTPSKSGQLVLWHGEPGTGKTFALRALGWEWRQWCDLHYISDPEKFFGSHANYMMQILTSESENDRWRLLILEDSGELLAADAKAQTGQGLSRLLNVVDGLIGQGLKIMVLITTNDEVKKMHPAVTRPGRCAAIIDFEKLTTEEIKAWAEANHLEVDTSKPRPIADLYAIADGYLPIERASASAPVGFGT